MQQFNNLRIALVHDSLTQLGGAERVAEVLHELFPSAPVFVLVMDRRLKHMFAGWDVRTSWLQVVYNFFPKFQFLFPLIPLAVRSFDFSGYDVVISSSSSFAKNIRVPKGVVHINYCHTPTRFLWTDGNYTQEELRGGLAIFRPLARLLITWMKRWDYAGAQRVTKFIANSREVQKRIQEYYGRESMVVYPPINFEFWHPVVEATGLPEAESEKQASGLHYAQGNYFLLAGRLQPHKKNELVVEIFNELGLPLHVAGSGRQEKYLRSMAKPNITFLGRITDEALRSEYRGAKGLIYPQLEDFGLMPLEAAACGTATLAYGRGGSLETIVPGVTGELFEKYDKEEVKRLILNWDAKKYNCNALVSHAHEFGKEAFKAKIQDILTGIYNENRH